MLMLFLRAIHTLLGLIFLIYKKEIKLLVGQWENLKYQVCVSSYQNNGI